MLGETVTARVGDRFEPLANPDFRRLFFSYVTTKFGYWLTFIALFELYVFDSEIGALGIGLFGLLEIIPNIVGSPVLSVLADRVSRRRILIATELGSGVLVLALTLYESLLVAYAVLFGLGLLSALAKPAQKALVPQVITDDDTLSQANGLVSAAGSAAQIGGPALGGALIVFVEPHALFVADAVSYLLSAVVLLTMAEYAISNEDDATAFGQFVSGLRYVRTTPTLAFVVAVNFAVFGALGFFDAMLPMYVREVFSGSAADLGAFAAAIAAGSLAASTLVGVLGDKVTPGTGIVVGTAADGIAIFGLARLSGPLPSLTLAFVVGAASTIVITYSITAIHQTSDDDHMGRVFGVYDGTKRTGQILTITGGSVVVAEFGIGPTFAGVGLAVFALGGVLTLRRFLGESTERLSPSGE